MAFLQPLLNVLHFLLNVLQLHLKSGKSNMCIVLQEFCSSVEITIDYLFQTEYEVVPICVSHLRKKHR